jgi:hypothetical protein
MTDEIRFTGVPANALYYEEYTRMELEFGHNTIHNMSYVWPHLRSLYVRVYYLVTVELPEDDPARQAFLEMAGKYIETNVFRLKLSEADLVRKAINFVLEAKGLLSPNQVKIVTLDWTFEEIMDTDRRAR